MSLLADPCKDLVLLGHVPNLVLLISDLSAVMKLSVASKVIAGAPAFPTYNLQ